MSPAIGPEGKIKTDDSYRHGINFLGISKFDGDLTFNEFFSSMFSFG